MGFDFFGRKSSITENRLGDMGYFIRVREYFLRVTFIQYSDRFKILVICIQFLISNIHSRIMPVNSADEFYSIMAVLTREMLEFGLMDANCLIKVKYNYLVYLILLLSSTIFSRSCSLGWSIYECVICRMRSVILKIR